MRGYHTNQQEGEDLDIDMSLPSQEELKRAVKTLKNNKAAGVDRVNSEMLKQEESRCSSGCMLL